MNEVATLAVELGFLASHTQPPAPWRWSGRHECGGQLRYVELTDNEVENGDRSFECSGCGAAWVEPEPRR